LLIASPLFLCLYMSTSINIKPRISIIGCGWYGMAVAKQLVADGYTVKGSTTTAEKLKDLAHAGIQPYLLYFGPDKSADPNDFFTSEILIICIPPKRNSTTLGQYPDKIAAIAKLATQYKTEQVLFISSTSVYADNNSIVDEMTVANPQTPSGQQILNAEQALQQNSHFTATVLRFSGLVGPGRHPGRFFTGKKDIPNGQAPINLVHLDDCIGITLEIIKRKAFGYIYNVSSPDHLQKQHFYPQAIQAAGLAAATFIDELKEWKIISSIQVPKQLNYTFKTVNWIQRLKDF
jgi:nucleoside-diphosphate-sugar epimerase